MYPTSDTRKNLAVIGLRPSSSRLRIEHGAAAPPLVLLPLSETNAVARHGGGIRFRDNGHNEQGHIESAHAGFWAMGGGYLGWTPERPGIKGEGTAVIRDLNEDGATPEEQDFSGYGPPQPASQANPFVCSFTTHMQTDTSCQINHLYLYKHRKRRDGIANT